MAGIMWNRDSWLEPEIAKETLATVSHAVEVSLTHFFAKAGVILLPSTSRCESMPLLQLNKRSGLQEVVISGVLFPIADDSGDCFAVLMSESIANKVVDGAKKWDDRLVKLKEGAALLVEPLSHALGIVEWGEPSFIFDMQAAALQAISAHAAENRQAATVISTHLNGLDPGEWTYVVGIIDAARLEPQSASSRRAA